MQLAIVGSQGMLGQDLLAAAIRHGHDAVGLDRGEVDITDLTSCEAAPLDTDIIINCAAYTNVDACESSEPDAFAVNAIGPANLARRTRSTHARLVQISTDYVFAGNHTSPIDEDAALAPISAYGRTKAAGEWAVRAHDPRSIIVRTAWLYGAHGQCFPKTIARLARERGSLDVVDDQYGQPTWTVDLAEFVLRLIEADAPGGAYHGTASGSATWFEFAQATVEAAGLPRNAVRPSSSVDLDRPAPRPSYSVLDHNCSSRIGISPIGDWRERWQQAADLVLADGGVTA